MKFLKGMISRKREDEFEDEQPSMSIETLQADLDHSGLDSSLRDPDSAWSEKAAQRPVEETGPDLQAVPGHDDALEPEDTQPDRRSVSRDLDWEDELGDAGDTTLREAFDAPRARRQTRPVAEDDAADEFDEFEEDEFDDEFDELEPEEEQAIRDNALLVEEIRDAIAAVRHIEADDGPAKKAPAAKEATGAKPAKGQKGWENDEVFGRKAIARDRLARLSESEDGDRILEETNSKMFDDDAANRRRQAMAHLKAAAAATKADSVLKRVVGRDPAMDPDQQVQYREDLANVVRQRGPRSEPISRPLSRPRSRPMPAEPAPVTDASELPASKTEPMTHEELRQAFSRPVEATEAPPSPQTEVHPEKRTTAETTMDVEKIDLKTALERQKAILKAEREALEAEIAAEEKAKAGLAPVEQKPEPVAEDREPIEQGPAAEIEPEEVEVAFDADAEEAAEDSLGAAFDDWDDGTADEDDADQAGAPVDVTALATSEPEIDRDEDGDDEAAIRDLDLEETAAANGATETVEADDGVPGAAPAAPARKAGRVKTRLLGFQSKSEARDVFAGKAATGAGPVRFPVGWLVVTQGEGFGHSFSLLSGVSKIGRGDDQAVQLDFGDTSISRDNHAAIAFDEELNQFFLGHGGKSNVVRLNGKPVLSTEELYDGDEIRIGETTLKFIALCSEDFTWAENAGDGTDHARSA
ncbi:MAG: FHA domain-containing protein [Paracoccaceae bacterium]|nr:FHA domain-containing protein [Paracoccaceae bacterium]